MEIRPLIGHRTLPLPSAGVCIQDNEGRFLLVRLKTVPGEHWSWPGGMLEVGETISQATIREMEEETGLRVKLTRLIGVYSGPNYTVRYSNGDQVEYTCVMFAGEVIGGAMSESDNTEIMETGYFSLEEMAKLPMIEGYRRIAHDAIQENSSAVWL